LECCHDLIAKTRPKKDDDDDSEDATLMARLISDLNTKITKEGALSLAKQCLLDEGIEVLGQKKSRDASIKEKWSNCAVDVASPQQCPRESQER
jgi:hypothetical protein